VLAAAFAACAMKRGTMGQTSPQAGTSQEEAVMSEKQKRQAKGHTEVTTYEPKPFDELPGAPSLVEIQVTETFSGDIQGEGVVRVVQAARADGSATLVGIERVRGSIHGKRGSFLLQVSGTLIGKELTADWSVVPGSGTGELAGLRGDGGFKAQVGQNGSIWLDYYFE
jgi:hypothetical protein